MNKLLIITGPTTTGKTDLAIQIAREFNGELIAADSRQVYTGLDIGTGKLPSKFKTLEKSDGFWEIDNIKIWGYDLIPITQQYTVYDFVKFATGKILDIQEKGKLPIVVGGTGLYIRGLTKGFPNLGIPVDLEKREELEKLSLEGLQDKLKALSPEKFTSLNESDRKNPRRLLRSLELVSMNPYIEMKEKVPLVNDMDILEIGLIAPKEILFEKSDLRVLDWISKGITREVSNIEILKRLGLQYGDIADFLEGEIKTEEELIKKMQSSVRRYIKRQLTWFKVEKDIIWFDVTIQNYTQSIETELKKWYHTLYANKD